MKIISDFVDFYDSCQDLHSSLEPSIVYMRKTHDLDIFQSLKIQEEMELNNLSLRRFTDKMLNPSWSITPFIIGASGRFNRGVEIRCGDTIEHSYTFTGAHYIPKTMGITLTPDIHKMIDQHFENPFFDKPCIFETVGAPVFVIVPDYMGFLKITANPQLESFCYLKVCLPGEIYLRIRAFIDNFLMPCDEAEPYTRQVPKTTKFVGLKASGWAIHDGLPRGY